MCTTYDGVDDSGDECDGQVDMTCPRETKRPKITADDCHDLIFEKAVGASWPLKMLKTHLPDVRAPRRKVFLDEYGIKSTAPVNSLDRSPARWVLESVAEEETDCPQDDKCIEVQGLRATRPV